MNTAWTKILSIIQENESEASFSVWIKPLQGTVTPTKDVTSPSELRIRASNGFVANFIRTNYLEKISSAAKTVLGSLPNIVIEANAAPMADHKPISTVELARDLPTAPSVMATGQQLLLPMPVLQPRIQKFRYSFDDFVVGPSNKLAHAAAEAIINRDAGTDILFMSSASGLGKTHLAQAIGQQVFKEKAKSDIRLAYLTAEDFTTQFVAASRFHQMDTFKDRFRSLDLLLLEDVHFLRGKEKTQEELLATIKRLHEQGGRVVLTSSFAPKDIQGVDSQLISRFCSGFIASIERPNKETRFGILMEKARRLAISLPENVAELMAEHITSDIRMLESCLQNMNLKAQLLQCPLTEELAMDIISSVAQECPHFDLDTIVRLICKSFTTTPQQLRSPSRRQDLVLARNTAFYLLRKHTGMTLEDIGKNFNRKHSTVIKGISTVEREISRQSATGAQIAHTVTLIEKNAARV